tara:strand:+ start:576 stop:749 length:174 start_codon:yes stop_codon:yes gene_type:complete
MIDPKTTSARAKKPKPVIKIENRRRLALFGRAFVEISDGMMAMDVSVRAPNAIIRAK